MTLIFILTPSTVDHKIRFMGTQYVAANGNVAAQGSAVDVLYMGRRPPGAPSPSYWKGSICDITFLKRALSQSEAEQYEGWSAHYYGLSAQLPGAHPYKSSPPMV